MKITLDRFARMGIENQLRTDLLTGVGDALSHYARQIQAGRAPVPPPRFLRQKIDADEGESFELPVGAEVRAILEREAAAHEVPVSDVLAHAVLVYLADGDSASSPQRP